MKILIVGMGGVGSLLANFMCKFVNYDDQLKKDFSIMLVDGDEYESKNKNRQEFVEYGNKADSKHEELQKNYPDLKIEAINAYVNADNAPDLFNEGDVIMLAVDNHKTRKVINDYCSDNLQDFVIISGGNELTDGSVHYYLKRGGKDITPSLTTYDLEIAEPKDKSPEEMSCEELSKSEPQLFFTNLQVATLMTQMFYRYLTTQPTDKHPAVTYFDITKHQANPVFRTPKN